MQQPDPSSSGGSMPQSTGQSAPPTLLRLDGSVVSPLSAAKPCWDREQFTSEAEAVEWALGQVGPNQDLVGITAHSTDVYTFAMRHFAWEGDDIRDTGWRLWRRGQFVGGGDLAEMEEVTDAVTA